MISQRDDHDDDMDWWIGGYCADRLANERKRVSERERERESEREREREREKQRIDCVTPLAWN